MLFQRELWIILDPLGLFECNMVQRFGAELAGGTALGQLLWLCRGRMPPLGTLFEHEENRLEHGI